VATRRYIDEQAAWTLMRFADEPPERTPSREITLVGGDDARRSVGAEQGEFDQAVERRRLHPWVASRGRRLGSGCSDG
jgi:hypothetical protein